MQPEVRALGWPVLPGLQRGVSAELFPAVQPDLQPGAVPAERVLAEVLRPVSGVA